MTVNILQDVIKGFRELLDPVFLATESEEAKTALLQSLGIESSNGSTLSIPPETINAIDQFTSDDPENAGLEAFLETMVRIDEIISLVEGFIRPLLADKPEEFVNEQLHFFFEFLTMTWMYQNRNNGYLLFEMMRAIEDHSINHGGLIQFFKKGIGFLVEAYTGTTELETEAHAKSFSDGVLAPFTIIMGRFFKAEATYGWDPDPNSSVPLADHVASRTGSLLYQGETELTNGDTAKGSIMVSYAAVPQEHQGPAMMFRFKGDGNLKVPLTKGLNFSLGMSAPDLVFSIPSVPGIPSSTDAAVSAKLSLDSSKTDFKMVIGDPKGTSLSFGTISAEMKATSKEFTAKASSKKAALKLKADDGFLGTILPKDGLKLSFELGLGWSTKKGLFFEGSAGTKVTIPIHDDFGPLRLNTLTLGLKGGGDQSGKATFKAESSVGFSLDLGPIVATVDRMGMEFSLEEPASEGGDMPVKIGVDFKPPSGVGLEVNAKVAKGGGFLLYDSDNGYYAGGLELTFNDEIEMAAMAIITTKQPDGEKGYSLLISVNILFTPPWSLGLGFFMSGIGFLMGAHHTLNIEALRAGIKTGTLDNILFPENMVQNVSQVLSDMRKVFPAKREQAFLGLMARITWGTPTLLVIDFGLVLELDNPVRLAILGVVKARVPSEDAAILSLQVNFLGVIDFEKKYLSFDASLFNSRLLAYTLEGDMALRLSWGEKSGFLLSVGGFHPAYSPPTHLNVPNLKRISLSLLSGNPTLKMSSYYAITSNTVQFGASIDFLFKKSKFKIVGYFGYDVLFQFNPFRFNALVNAGVDVRVGSKTLFAIALEFDLSGPAPWTAKGFAKFKVFFFSVKIRFCKTWGERREVSAPSVAVLSQGLGELAKPENWKAKLPSRRFMLVSLRETQPAAGEVLLQSAGSLEVEQTLLPMGIGMTRIGQNKIRDISHWRVRAMRVESQTLEHIDVRGNFAPAAFKEMSDDDKLKAPSFVKERSGVRLKSTDKISVGYAINRIISYEVRASDHDPDSGKDYDYNEPVDQGRKQDDKVQMRRQASGGAVRKSPLSQTIRRRDHRLNHKAVQLAEERFRIVGNDTMDPETGFEATGTRAEADDLLRELLRQKPHRRGKVQIVSQYELA